MQRLIRSVLFSGTVVGSGYLGLKYGKKDQLSELQIPQPLPDVDNASNEYLLLDTVTRYSRMAPVYDGLLDKVENKYQGFELRKKLLTQANGHVLEIGVGTARNIQFYDNSKVQSITYVDSTYPMLNAALVKVNDLYGMYEKDGVLVAANQKFTFPVVPTKSIQELQEEWLEGKKRQMALVDGDGGIPQDNPQNIATTQQNTDTYPHHATFRPQLLIPKPSNSQLPLFPMTSSIEASPAALNTVNQTLSNDQLQQLLEPFPQRIKELFLLTTPSRLNIYDMKSVDIEHERDVGERILDHTREVTQPSSDPTPQHSFGRHTLSPDAPLSNQEKERAAKREELLKQRLESGQEWKTMTSQQNIIPAAFLHLDAHDLSFFPPNSYDTVVDTFGLCSFHHPVDVLREIRRVCKPGGKVLLLEHGLGTNWAMNQVIYQTNESHKKQWGCDRSKDIVALLNEAGFDARLVQRRHSGTTLIYDGKPPKAPSELLASNVNAGKAYYDLKVHDQQIAIDQQH